MTRLKVGNVWTEVEPADAQLRALLSFRPKGYKFAPSYKFCRICGDTERDHERQTHTFTRNWDGSIQMTRMKDGKLYMPSGLVPWLLEQPGQWDVDDYHVKPPAGFDSKDWLYHHEKLVELDQHQEAAVTSSITAGQGIIQYPTGVGKGRIIGELVRRLNVRSLVICDKLDLLKQLEREITEATGVAPGVVGGGWWVTSDATVATFQTLTENENDPRVKQLLRNVDCVIIDEAHHAAAKGLSGLLQQCPAYWRLGLSATAFKSYAGKATDRGTFLQVQAFLGPPIETMTISEGVETGRIVPADVYIIQGCRPDPSIRSINYKEEYQHDIVENAERNTQILILARRLSAGVPTVILTSRLDHGEYLALNSLAPFVHGSTKPKEREGYYSRFKRGEIPILVIGKLGDEALDLPNIGALILAGGGNSPHVQIQRIGRSLRASEGKDRAMVFDFEDFGKYIGPHYRRRRRTYDAEAAYTIVDVDRSEL